MIAYLEEGVGLREVPGQLSQHPWNSAAGSTARDQLIREHLPLVRKVVSRMARTLSPCLDPEELHSYGVVGLLDAARRFDPGAAAAFESYATMRIRGSVIDELRKLDWVPRSVHIKARKVEAVVQELAQENGEMPDDSEIAAAMNLSPAQFQKLQESIQPVTFVHLEASPPSEEDEQTRHDWLADESQENPSDSAARLELSRMISDLIPGLPKMQRLVLTMHYFEDMRIGEIARSFHVSSARICQIHAEAIHALRSLMQAREAVKA